MLGAVASIGSSLLGGLFGKSGADKQNKAQIASAREQMAFQERMSNTAHQREVKDLEAAGLNPILSAKLGGASSPGGAMPNIVNAMAPMQNAAQSMGDKLFNFRIQDATVDNMKLQNDVLQQQVEQLKISNARQGLLTPVYDQGGKIIDKIAGLFNGPDIVQDVMDAAGDSLGGTSSEPSSAKLFDPTRFELPIGTKDSEARKWSRGEKTFLQSIRDANKPKLTEETLRRYGIRRLNEINQRAKNRDLREPF